MDRRKFIIGAGSTAIGGAAVLGSGAFSRIEAQRRTKLEITSDPNAYLGLDGCPDSANSSYTELDGQGHLAIELSPENPTEGGGAGVNSDSRSWFDRMFQVCNNGKDDVCFWIEDHDEWPMYGEERRLDFYLEGDDETSVVGSDNALLVEVGECYCIGAKTVTKGLSEGDQLLADLNDELVLVADSTVVTTGSGDIASQSQTGVGPLSEHDDIQVTDLADPDVTPLTLAELLVGDEDDVSIDPDSVEYTGATPAAGAFTGAGGIIGIQDGIILSSGRADDVVGPNESASTSTSFGTPGDDDLSDLVGGATTYDASILEFEFEVPAEADSVFFRYVFGSEEYNEYVGSAFNDVFAFFVNGENAALVPDPDNPDETLPAAINNINHGYGTFDPVNPELYINNDPFHGDNVVYDPLDVDEAPYNTEMDGFTVVLDVEAEVDPDSVNTMKLAIADTADAILDSWVLIEGGSLATSPPDEDPEPTIEC